jgi:antitoxin component YwqK of YwqJK toxin-antitoxin module
MKITTTHTLFLPLIVASLCLSACGDKVLDYRNADLSNGAFYARGENSPFNGTVTNVPNAVVFNDPDFTVFRQAVAKAYGSAIQMAATQRIDLDQFGRQASALLQNTGLYFPNNGADASVLCTVKVDDGKLVGKISCAQAGTDNVVLEAKIGNGSFDGPIMAYVYDSGKQYPFVSATLKDGKLDGKDEIYSPTTHKLIYSASYVGGIPQGTEDMLDENTGNKLQEANYLGGKLEGDVTDWAPGGNQITSKGHYANGLFDGSQEAFDANTGKKIGEAHWSSGKLNGELRKWDVQGNLIAVKSYENGFLATTSDEQETRFAEGQDPNHPAVYVPLATGPTDNPISAPANPSQPVQAPSNQTSASPDPSNEEIAHQIQRASPEAKLPVSTQPISQITSSSNQTSNVPDVSKLSADGPAAKRCGWVENDMPSSLTLKDRDGTWNIVGGQVSGEPAGFDQMPPTDKGDSCGCLTVQTNHQAMQIVKIGGGELKPVAACQQDKSLK